MKTTYKCPLAWSHLEVDVTGKVRQCCRFPDYITDSSGEYFNLKNDHIGDIITSEYSNDVRARMVSGAYLPECEKCMVEERNGIESRRVTEIKHRPDFDYNNEPSIESLDIKLGNYCNLKCVVCNAYSSDKVLTEQITLGWFPTLSEEQYKDFKWYTVSPLWDDIIENKSIKHIDFMGGEPFIVKEHFKFLDRMIANDMAKSVSLNYVTNATFVQEKLLDDVLSQFDSVNFTLSSDGSYAAYEYCRYPANWDTFTTNVDKILSRDFNYVGVCYSVSMYSVWDLCRSLDYYKDKGIPVWLNIVYNDEYHIRNLPDELKDKLIDKLSSEWKDEYTSFVTGGGVDSLTNLLRESRVEEHWNLFVSRTKQRDSIRNNNVVDIIPEYKEYFNE